MFQTTKKLKKKTLVVEKPDQVMENPVKIEKPEQVAENPAKIEKSDQVIENPVEIEKPDQVVENPAKIEKSDQVIENPVETEKPVEEQRENKDKTTIDFFTRRTNWMYRSQERIYRVKTTTFERIDPFTKQVKETFYLSDILNITVVDSCNCIINFCSKKESQYINFLFEGAFDNFLKAVSERALRFSNTEIQCINKNM